MDRIVIRRTDGSILAEGHAKDAGALLGRRLAQGGDLVGADLSRLSLRGVDLKGADLSGAALVGTDLAHADLTDARLDGADMTGCLATGCSFVRTSMRGLSAASMNAARADFSGADLRANGHAAVNLENAVLDAATLHGAVLDGAGLRRARLTGADLRKVSARHASFRDASFVGASLRGGTFKECDFRGADMEGADQGDVVAMGCKFADAKGLEGAFAFDKACRVPGRVGAAMASSAAAYAAFKVAGAHSLVEGIEHATESAELGGLATVVVMGVLDLAEEEAKGFLREHVGDAVVDCAVALKGLVRSTPAMASRLANVAAAMVFGPGTPVLAALRRLEEKGPLGERLRDAARRREDGPAQVVFVDKRRLGTALAHVRAMTLRHRTNGPVTIVRTGRTFRDAPTVVRFGADGSVGFAWAGEGRDLATASYGADGRLVGADRPVSEFPDPLLSDFVRAMRADVVECRSTFKAEYLAEALASMDRPIAGDALAVRPF